VTGHRRRRGAAALEFAVCAPAFFVLVLAVMELGWQFTVSAGLEHGARLAGRLGITGAAMPGGSRDLASVTRAVLAGVPVLQAGRLTVAVHAYAGLDAFSAGQPPVEGTGGPSALVEYRLDYVQPWLTPFGRAAMGAALTHHAVVVVQNEPFPQK
jgi:hypothetical protein